MICFGKRYKKYIVYLLTISIFLFVFHQIKIPEYEFNSVGEIPIKSEQILSVNNFDYLILSSLNNKGIINQILKTQRYNTHFNNYISLVSIYDDIAKGRFFLKGWILKNRLKDRLHYIIIRFIHNKDGDKWNFITAIK